jgi:hypothetical protein
VLVRLTEDLLLAAPPVVEEEDRGGVLGEAVCEDDLVVVVRADGSEEVELLGAGHDLLALAVDLLPVQDEPDPAVDGRTPPALGQVSRLCARPSVVDAPPLRRGLHDMLQLREPFEGHAAGERDILRDERGQEVPAEEGGVHPTLDDGLPGRGLSDSADAAQHELLRALAVVDVAGTVEQVQEGAELGDGAVLRVVAPSPLLLLVEADRRPLGERLRGLHRAVEVQGHPRQLLPLQPLQDEIADQSSALIAMAVPSMSCSSRVTVGIEGRTARPWSGRRRPPRSRAETFPQSPRRQPRWTPTLATAGIRACSRRSR